MSHIIPARNLGCNRVIGHTKLISCSRKNQSQILTEWQAKNINLAHPSLVLRQAVNDSTLASPHHIWLACSTCNLTGDVTTLLPSPSSSHRWVCVYPAYINAKKTLKEGRRIPRDKATTTPLCSEICDVCVSQGLNAEVEGKLYPREPIRDHIHYGRVRVQLKDEEGKPCNERITTSVYG